MLDRLITSTHSFSRVLVWIGGGLILASSLLVTAEVLMRKLLNVSIGGADELSGYAFGIATTLGFAFALFERAHIRVDALYGLFPRPLKVMASLFGLVLLTGFAALVSMTAWSMVADTLHHGSHSITPMRTPLAWPQVPWLAGWIYMERADALVGMKSVQEQIEDETR